MLKYIDIHSHLHSDFFKDDSKGVIKEMGRKKVGTILVGVDLADSQKAVELASQYKNIWAVVGVHPTSEEQFNEAEFQKLLDENKQKIVGIGECGLDYFHKPVDKGRQKKLFIQQIKFAEKNDLPLMLHVRSDQSSDAYRDVIKTLDENLKKEIGVNFHFFTETPEIAQEIAKRGWFVSFPGVITFADLDETVKSMPSEQIMVDSDSPFAAPIPYRGKTNLPIYISEIVKKIAQVKNISENKCQGQILRNTKNFFGV